VSVLNDNKCGIVANLEKADFAKQRRQDPKQTYLRWNPSNDLKDSLREKWRELGLPGMAEFDAEAYWKGARRTA
jgi:hypothetical protein